jgi:hypothetical protein
METTTKKETYVNFLEGIFTGADDVDGRGSLNKNPSRARAVLVVRYSRVCVCVDIFSCEFCLFFSSSSFPYFVLYMYTHTKRSGGGKAGISLGTLVLFAGKILSIYQTIRE